MRIETLKKKRAKARAIKQARQHMDDDIHDYVLPYRRGSGHRGQKGEDRVSEIYDQTAPIAALRFAGKFQRDISPVDGPTYTLEPGPLIKTGYGREAHEELARQLSGISTVLASFNHSGEWDLALWEMAVDLNGGTGFVAILEGEEDSNPVRYFAIPPDEMLILPGGYGGIAGKFWSRKWSFSSILDIWPDASFSDTLAKKSGENPEDEVMLNQDLVWRAEKKRWELTVWIEGEESPMIAPALSRECPILSPRYYKLSDEVWGRGVANLVMPAIKTVNTSQRLTLMAGAIALMGIYTVVDDGVFNPDLSDISPGSMWKVRSNGGVFGPSVKQLAPPRLDLANIVNDDLRMGIKQGMLDDALPPDTGAVRSPTEIIERVKRLAADHLGAFGRMVREVVIPKARREIEIAWNKKLIQSKVPLDQLLVQVKVVSPVAMARETERVQNIINWLEMVLSVAGTAGIAPKYIAKIENALAELGRAMQVPGEFIVTEVEREEMKAADQAQALALALAQAGQKAGLAGDGAAPVPAGSAPESATVEAVA